jgi:hypothetical protein
MTHCIEMPWTGAAPRRSLVGKRAPERRPRPNIEFKSKREAEIWAAIYADQSCHPFHRWEVEQAGAIFSVAVYDANTGAFSHWAEP